MRAADTPAQAGTPVGFNIVVEDDHHNRVAGLKSEDIALTDDGHTLKTVELDSALLGNKPRRLSVLVDSSSVDSVRLASEFLSSADLSNLEIGVWDAIQLQLLQSFTSDRAALTAALARLQAANGPAVTAAAQSTDEIVREAADHVQNEQLRPWMAILFALAAEQGSLPGRKEALCFLSNEDQSSATDEQISALVSNAAHAELSVYILESRPLTVRAEAQAARLVAGKPKRASKKGPATEPQPDTSLRNVLRDLASKTGGLYAVAHSGQATWLFHSAITDMADSYEVRYVPEISAFDGHFRKLEVRCSRPGAKVRAPAGYFSAPPASFVDLTPSEPNLYAYLQSGKPETSFPVDCQLMQFGHKDGKVRTEIVIQVPVRALQAEEDETGTVSRVRFSVLALVKTEDGRIVQKLAQQVLYQTAKGGAKSNVYSLTRPIWLMPGKYRVEVAARDENSERATVKEMPLTVSGAAPGADLADILLVRGAQSGAGTGTDDPLTYGTARIVPFASPSINLSKGSELPVLITAYPEGGGLPSEVELEIRRGNELYGTVPLLGTVDQFGRYRALLLLEQASLPPGHYSLTARALTGEKTVEQRREMDVVAGEPAADADDDTVPEPVKPVFALEEPVVVTGKADEKALASILEGARNRAEEYKRNLPNFSCVETTQQYAAKTAPKLNWKVKNTFSELLRYASGAEDYHTIEVNGERKTIDRADLPGVRTDGEFGELLAGIYSEKSAAKFELKGKARIDGADVYAVAYSIERPHSFYMLATVDGNSRVQCAFHGTLYIDAHDFATRYVSIEAQDLPTNAQYRESTLFVTYDYISFDGSRYLLPKRACISVRVGKSKLMKDDIQFRDYRKFHATTRMIFQ